MISLDWKERLRRDTEDFYRNKLPEKFYDIEIIYNAYPQRINNNIPVEVVNFVGKQIAGKTARNAEGFLDFFDYIFHNKGDNGKIIFAHIMHKALKNDPDKFMPYLEEKLFELEDVKQAVMIVDKAISPLVKKEPEKFLRTIVSWAKKDHPTLTLSMQKLIVRIIQTHPEHIKDIFHHLESGWLHAGEPMVKLNISVLKAIYKADKDQYFKIFSHYRHTREPVFAEILTGAIMDYHADIEKAVTNWAHSGNVHLKKFGIHGQKIIKRKKGKN